MGVFNRFKDIVSSNISALLDGAEDPRKLIRLMVREMEETLVELKAGCAGIMAERKALEREREAVAEAAAKWHARAELAVDKGREELAREALLEKNAHLRRQDALDAQAAHLEALVGQAREDIARLEDKLASAREKQRLLEQRHARARSRTRAGQTLTRADSSDAMRRFDDFESRIERLESEAELAAPGRGGQLEQEFALLEKDDIIAAELAEMKSRSRAGAPKARAAKADVND
ncbi:PspA/IM30 family protein [Desulfocurvus sp.]|uniref:PspA/IM30 family protein n=1 Tax=Desulfocurvus sp. TaxID=2871698 RepID=UPI0025BCE5D6|nr:PspA/IM30 family protein [Desulfocurvus sp.]MCK9241038.1 PspA/IM30 family protein [Desulfocurvus sp.]